MNDMTNNLSTFGTDSADFDWSDYAWDMHDEGGVFDYLDDACCIGECAQ